MRLVICATLFRLGKHINKQKKTAVKQACIKNHVKSYLVKKCRY